MRLKISILYSWFVKTITYFWPNFPQLIRLRGFLYSLMMEQCGKDFQVHSSATLVSLSGLNIGNHVYIGPNCVILSVNLKIEDEVLIGPNCIIASGNHTQINGSYRFGAFQRGAIVIKKGSWISGNCSVLSGAVLPESSILGAGSTLNKEYQTPSALYAGSPAVFKKVLL